MQFDKDTRLYFFKSEHEKDSVRQARLLLETQYQKQRVSRLSQAQIVVALGGDGTFLEAENVLSNTSTCHAALLGMAYGTVNYLMNKPQELPSLVQSSHCVDIHPLIVSYSQGNGIYCSQKAFNEVVLHRIDPHNQTCHLNVQAGKLYGSINGDGLLATHPQGRHGYHFQANGKFIPLFAEKVGLQPICDRSAQNLSCLVPDSQKITIEVQDFHKRPVVLNADNNLAIQNVVRCTIEMDKKTSIPVLWSNTAPIMAEELQWLKKKKKVAHQSPLVRRSISQLQRC